MIDYPTAVTVLRFIKVNFICNLIVFYQAKVVFNFRFRDTSKYHDFKGKGCGEEEGDRMIVKVS